MTGQNESYRNAPPRYDRDAFRNVWERPGDPRKEPALTDRPRDAWADDREPGCGLARALVMIFGGAVFAVAIWSLMA